MGGVPPVVREVSESGASSPYLVSESDPAEEIAGLAISDTAASAAALSVSVWEGFGLLRPDRWRRFFDLFLGRSIEDSRLAGRLVDGPPE